MHNHHQTLMDLGQRSGGFRGVSVVTIETPLVPDRCIIVLCLSMDQERLFGFRGISFLDKVPRDLLWLTLE